MAPGPPWRPVVPGRGRRRARRCSTPCAPTGCSARTGARVDGSLPYAPGHLAADEPLSLPGHPSSAQAAEDSRGERRGHPGRRARPQLPRRQPQAGADLPGRVPRAWWASRGADPRAAACAGRRRARHTSRCSPRSRTRRACACSPGSRCHSPCWTGALPALQAACVRLAQEGGSSAARRGWRWSCRANEHPGDAGVLAALLLSLAVLQPGEALPARGEPARTCPAPVSNSWRTRTTCCAAA